MMFLFVFRECVCWVLCLGAIFVALLFAIAFYVGICITEDCPHAGIFVFVKYRSRVACCADLVKIQNELCYLC
jgi:hypothetical protein